MPPHILLHKERGQTPLEAIDAWRAEHPEYSDIPAAYAGRLDPMASGKLLILLGDECKQQKRYFGLDKEYEIEVMLDVSTDTGDALGIPSYADRISTPSSKELLPVLRRLTGTHLVPYPAFSSKPVKGKPLFMHTLEGTLESVDIPEHEETVYGIELLSSALVSTHDLRKRIDAALAVVPRSEETSKGIGADFRQDRIRAEWSSLLEDMPERNFCILSLRVTCASGTYMRTLAERLASELGTQGFALSIARTRIGKLFSLGRFRFWLKQY